MTGVQTCALPISACAQEVQPANDLWFEDRTTKSGLLWQHYAFNEQQEAREALTQALRLDSGNPDYRAQLERLEQQ